MATLAIKEPFKVEQARGSGGATQLNQGELHKMKAKAMKNIADNHKNEAEKAG